MGQGSNAWHNGDRFEKVVSEYLEGEGYNISSLSYESLDHNKRERPLDVYVSCVDVAVECKHYKAWGSKVQNYCWDLYNAAKCVPCDTYYAVWQFEDKSGKTQKCFERAVEMAKDLSKISKKKLHVVTWEEFKEISKKGLRKDVKHGVNNRIYDMLFGLLSRQPKTK